MNIYEQNILYYFPDLKTLKITSEQDEIYNCIAFAANDTNKWWWPDIQNIYYWPPKIQRIITLDAFIDAFGSIGYVVCDNADYESGFEKVAIYAKDDIPTHAARQLGEGCWTSKLGRGEDIEHATPEELKSDEYGEVRVFLKRKVKKTFKFIIL